MRFFAVFVLICCVFDALGGSEDELRGCVKQQICHCERKGKCWTMSMCAANVKNHLKHKLDDLSGPCPPKCQLFKRATNCKKRKGCDWVSVQGKNGKNQSKCVISTADLQTIGQQTTAPTTEQPTESPSMSPSNSPTTAAPTKRPTAPLIAPYNATLVNEAWERIEAELYQDAIQVPKTRLQKVSLQYGTDYMSVTRGDDGVCWVLARESKEAGNWLENIKFFKSKVLSTVKVQGQHTSCGCDGISLFGVCPSGKYKTCEDYAELGDGMVGFVNSYNAMRFAVIEQIKSECFQKGSSRVVLAGYSRGGAIVNVFALLFLKDELVAPQDLSLVTFGSPRSLAREASDFVEQKFPQWRMVHSLDGAPVYPLASQGYKHFGQLRCYNCTYDNERDLPTTDQFAGVDPSALVALGKEAHLSYCQVFGDKLCK